MPQSQRFTDEQIQQTTWRAQQIAGESQTDPAAVVVSPVAPQLSEQTVDELASYLAAAEEMGIPREAALQALREKLLLPAEAVRPGDMVFAPSVDGHSYPATVLRESGEGVVVRFASGGEHTVARLAVRPFSVVPGLEVEYEEKDWGWVKATVRAFEKGKKKVEVANLWETKKVPLEKVRLAAVKPPKSARELKVRQLLWRASLAAGGTGVLIGWLLGHFLR